MRTPITAGRRQSLGSAASSTSNDGGESVVPERARRLLVVSHPAVVSVNQLVYRELMRRGWDVTIVLPSRWRHDYAATALPPQHLEGMASSLLPTAVLFSGSPQRHLYLTSCRALCRKADPDIAFLEAEPFALPAAQWSFTLGRLGVPFGVQCYENIDRELPLPVRRLRSRVLRRAAFVAARSDSAAQLARAWGARGDVALAPPAVPSWDLTAKSRPAPMPDRPFTIGYAGRLVESKGLRDLLEAVRKLAAPVELLLIGDGEMRAELDGQPIPGSNVRILSDLSHDQMAAGYAQVDVLVLPSRTTATWKEQFGRVIIESLWCGVPVVGSDSGEIPWLIELTGGGVVFPEGDSDALARELGELRDDPALRERLAGKGRTAVEGLFSVSAATDSLEQILLRALAGREGRPRQPR